MDSDGGEGVVDSERREQGMVDSGGGEGVNAYPMEYKKTTTIVSLSASPTWCHIADCDTVPLARCIVCGTGDVVCLSFPLVGAGRRLTVVGALLPFCRCWWLHLFIARSFVGHWPSFAGHCALCVRMSSRWVVGVVLGGWHCMWWCRRRDVACGRHGGHTLCC